MWVLWLVCLVATAVAVSVEEITEYRVGPVSSVPLPGLVSFLSFTLAWLWPDRGRVRRMVSLTAVLLLVIHLVTSLLLAEPAEESLRVSAATVVQGAVTLALYRLQVGDNNLTPHRPRDLVDLFISSLMGSLVALLIGPMARPLLTADPVDSLWWTMLSTCVVFVGGACVMLLVQRSPQTEAVPTRLLDVYLQLLTAAVALGVVFAFPEQPLTWIVLLPAIWAGMTMGPWTSAGYALTASVAVVVAQAVPAVLGQFGSSSLPNIVLFDVLMASFTFVVLLLSLLRDQRAYLSAEVVERRQIALDQAGLLSTVFESINDALVLVDLDGNVRLHNVAATQLLGRERVATEPAAWLRRGTAGSFTYVFNRDGSEDGARALAVHLQEVQYAGSDSVVAVARDVTTERQRIEELTSFAAVAAHDLKSPLAAVQGWIEVADDALGDGQSDNAVLRRALDQTRTATTRMTREIEDWLAYNVAREGTVSPERVWVQPVVESIVEAHPGADFLVHAPDTVLVDPTLFQHLMLNLIGNAVKYTLPGERPQVTVRSFAGGEPGWVRIYVVDAGIGVPEGEEAGIFEPFRRARGVAGTYEGSGLGLALCKRIVRRHGGAISARRNTDGPGSTITVTLPAG
jgi:signal transduction histidine kinase